MKFIRPILRILLGIVGLALLLALLPYCFSAVYDFPAAEPFTGDSLYNPYSSIPHFVKANFHAHATAYKGVTDGHTSEHEMYSAYKAMNYDIVGISNYQTIDTTFRHDSGYIPLYEHGYNLFKRHHIALGAREVSYWDYLLFQTIDQKQDMLKRLSSTTRAVAIAHPKFRGSFDPEDFTRLTDYTCIEVLNHYRTSAEAWDSALSSGYAAWILADDDTHDSRSDGETGVCWTMIATSSPQQDSVIHAIQNGRMYGVSGKHGMNVNTLRSVSTNGMECSFTFGHAADSILLIGQNGTIHRKFYRSDSARYTFGSQDTYIRAMVCTGEHTMWLNPIIRIHSSGLQHRHAEENILLTWLWRLGWSSGLLLLIRQISKAARKKNRAVQS